MSYTLNISFLLKNKKNLKINLTPREIFFYLDSPALLGGIKGAGYMFMAAKPMEKVGSPHYIIAICKF